MKKVNRRIFCISVVLLLIFLVFTILLRFVDVKVVGPNQSSIGFKTFNVAFHNLTGVNMTLYNITDWLGLVPIFIAMGFAFLGLLQWIKRKKIKNVDGNILLLGIFYIVVIAVYIFFEYVVVNYRPILINGYLEASYPSSTTMLVMTIMPTALKQFKFRIKNKFLNNVVAFSIISFILFMVVSRLISGVHWLTDIIGGIIISSGLVMMYNAFSDFTQNR